jgi:hypothetical protein
LLKIATFYESPDLTKIFRHFVDRVVNDQTVLSVVADFLEFQLVGDAVRLAPRLARLTHLLIRGDPEAPFTRERLFHSIPAVLAGILGDSVMSDLTSDEKVAFIDEYVAAKGVPSEADCQLLAALIDWSPQIHGNYNLFTRNKCDWVPPDRAFPLIAQVIASRSAILSEFSKEAQRAAPNVSRWYPLGWLRALADAKRTRNSPKVDVVEFMSTVAGSATGVNPLQVGFLKVGQAGRMIVPRMYDADKIFYDGSYFMAQADGDELPTVAIHLFGAQVEVASVSVNLRVPLPIPRVDVIYPTPQVAPQRFPPAVEFRLANSFADLFVPEKCFSMNVEIEEGVAIDKELPEPISGSVIAVRFPKDSKNPVQISRLKSFTVYGAFQNK